MGVEEFVDRTIRKNETLVKKIIIDNFVIYWNSTNIQKNETIFSLSIENKISFSPKNAQQN